MPPLPTPWASGPRVATVAFAGAIVISLVLTIGVPSPTPVPATSSLNPPAGALIALAGHQVHRGRVDLEWSTAYSVEAPALVERATPGSPWQAVGPARPDEDHFTFTDRTPPAGPRVGYRLVVRTRPEVVGPELWIDTL